MSDTIIFDTHRFVKRMTDAGMASPIAEALADEYTQLLERNLSTKQDIARLEGTTRQDIARLEGTTRQDIARLETRLADSKVEIIKWNVGTMFAFGAILLALLKFL